MVVASPDEGRTLLQSFAGALAEHRVFAGQRARLEVGRADFELSADTGDEAFSQHAGLAEFNKEQALFTAW